MRITEQGAGDRESLLLAPGYFDAALADYGVETLVRPRQESVCSRLVQDVEALGVGCVGIHELEILADGAGEEDRKSTRLNSSHLGISYAVFCLKKKKKKH